MSQTHITFAVGYPEDNAVINGMKNNYEIFIEIDLDLALKNGINFFISSNKLVVSSGINGIISPIFF